MGQRNHSQLTRSHSVTANGSYVKQGNSYHLLNSNPRPCSYSSLFSVSPKASKRPPPCVRRSPTNVMNALTVNAGVENPIPRISLNTRRWSNTSRGSEQSVPRSLASPTAHLSPHDDMMQEILKSLSHLTGKVDSMLNRMDHLETWFSRGDSNVDRNQCEVNFVRFFDVPAQIELRAKQ